jgi:tRNA U34 5-methylaminomethyl-2-thiouridine-forming methyltransferase MnmC
MQRAYANKLIRTWPIAEAMFEAQSNGLAPIGAKKLNQATMWELVPVADAHGVDAARVVYGAVLEVDGVPVTAEVINAAVKALPSKGKFDAKAATSAVRKAVEKMKAPLSPSVPRRRSTLPSQAKAARGASGLPWGSPEALDRLMREHMTPEDRAVLAKLLAVD